MASTEDRIRQLLRDNLDITDHVDFDASFGDHDISSVDAVAFAKLVGQTFGRQIPPADRAQIQTRRGLADYPDSNAG